MNAHQKVAATPPTAIAALAMAFALLSCSSAAPTSPDAPTSPTTAAATPSPTPVRPSPTASPTRSPSEEPSPSQAAGPALTERFTSTMHGISVSYPLGWTVLPATEPWATSGLFRFQDPVGDFLYDPLLTDHLFLGLASQPLAGRSPDTWAADLLALEGCPSSDPLVVDGADGILAADCGMALVSNDDRGYMIWLYVSTDDPGLDAVYSLDWLVGLLATAQLDPSSAVQVSDPFRPAFTFVFPSGAAFDYGQRNETYFEVRVPAFADAGMPSGVIVQAIGAGRADPCDAGSEPLEIDPGPQSVIDYLKTIPDLAVMDEAPTSVGGLPAVQATVTGAGDTLACDGIYAWVEETEPFSAIPLDGPRRLVAVDVGSEHIVLTVFGEDGNPSWPPMAAELLDSIAFD